MSASSYQRMARALDDQKCSTCHGLGRCDDAEPGDIGFNEWACTACGGSGLTQPAQSVDDAALLDFMGRECLTVRCESTDDDDVEWDVVGYHMDAPKERVIGTGTTPREALTAALAKFPHQEAAHG